jgi:hypothetical protein
MSNIKEDLNLQSDDIDWHKKKHVFYSEVCSLKQTRMAAGRPYQIVSQRKWRSELTSGLVTAADALTVASTRATPRLVGVMVHKIPNNSCRSSKSATFGYRFGWKLIG